MQTVQGGARGYGPSYTGIVKQPVKNERVHFRNDHMKKLENALSSAALTNLYEADRRLRRAEALRNNLKGGV